MKSFFLISDILFFLGFIAHAFIASLVIQQRNKRGRDLVFLALMITTALWFLANLFASLNQQTLEISADRAVNVLFSMSYFLVCYEPALIFHLIYLLTHGETSVPRRVYLSYLPCVPLSFFPLAAGIAPGSFSVVVLSHFLFLLSAYFTLYFAFAGAILLRRKRMLDLAVPGGFLWGIAFLTLILAMIFGTGLETAFHTTRWAYAYLAVKCSVLIASLIVSIYLLRYNFMDYFLRKGTVYSLLSGLVLMIYLLVVRFGGAYLGHRAGVVSSSLEILLLFVIILLLQPLRHYLQRLVDRLFYRERAEYREALRKFSKTLELGTDVTEVCTSVLEEIMNAMKVRRGGIGTVVEGRLKMIVWKDEDPTMSEEHAHMIERQSINTWRLLEGATPTEDVPVRLSRDLLLQAGVRAVVPIRPGWKVMGLLFLGPKRSEEIYFKEDLDLLEAVAAPLGLALENLALLQKKVEMERKVYHTRKLASIGELAATVAHEIRNPLAGIKCLVQQMDEEASPGEALKVNTETILSEINRMDRIVAQLLAFSRKEDYQFTTLEPDSLLRETVRGFQISDGGKNLEIREEISTPSLRVRGDREKLQQVFINILDNASHAARAGSDKPRVAVTAGPSPTGDRYLIGVHDNGGGIPAEQAQEVFNPFFTTKEKGTGLGLAISQKIVEAHGGEIRVKSDPHPGTLMEVSLPLDP